MKIFRTSSTRRRRGETAVSGEFTFHMPAQQESQSSKRLEIECFKKKRETKPNIMSKHINSLESLKSDTDSDYDSMPRSEESELCMSLNKFRFQDTLPHFCERIPAASESRPSENAHAHLHQCSSTDSDDSVIGMAQSTCAETKVLLFPEEEWARNAKSIQWSIRFNRWWKRLCIVTETSVGGSHVKSAEAKVVESPDGGLTIIGRFKRLDYPDFQLHLAKNLTKSDIQKGYAMTGDLYQGDLSRFRKLEVTHFAAIAKTL